MDNTRRCPCGKPTRGPGCATCDDCYPGRQGSGTGKGSPDPVHIQASSKHAFNRPKVK